MMKNRVIISANNLKTIKLNKAVDKTTVTTTNITLKDGTTPVSVVYHFLKMERQFMLQLLLNLFKVKNTTSIPSNVSESISCNRSFFQKSPMVCMGHIDIGSPYFGTNLFHR
jgi:hypothetical protein